MVKSELVLKVVDRDKMIAFINLVDKTIIEYQSVAELIATLKELESELLSNRDRLKLLEENIEKDIIGRGDEKSPNNIITTNDDMFWQRP